MTKSQQLHTEAMKIAAEAFQAQQDGDAAKYLNLTKKAYEKEKEAA